MNIDWSKAPEDATHVGTKQVPGVTCWYKLKEGVFYFWYCTNDDLDFDGWAESKGDPIHTPLIERPKKQEAWYGVGLPPVNCFCETLDEDADCWVKVEIYAHTEFMGETHACAKNGTDMFYGLAHEFRPIKTAEQLAAEERDKAVFEIAHILIDNRHDSAEYHQAGRIYDAGYRKQ